MFRLQTSYFTTAANANEQFFTFNTNDEYRVRHVRTLFVGISTSGVQVAMYVNGNKYGGVDCTRFAAGDAVLHFEVDVPAKTDIMISITNLAGGALTNVPVVIGYEVDAGSGP